MKKRIHVNQHNIKSNSKNGTDLPVVSVKTYKTNRYGHEVAIVKDGVEVARVKYRPDKPLSCGARVWIETDEEVELFLRSQDD